MNVTVLLVVGAINTVVLAEAKASGNVHVIDPRGQMTTAQLIEKTGLPQAYRDWQSLFQALDIEGETRTIKSAVLALEGHGVRTVVY